MGAHFVSGGAGRRSVARHRVLQVRGDEARWLPDELTGEEPLEIRLVESGPGPSAPTGTAPPEDAGASAPGYLPEGAGVPAGAPFHRLAVTMRTAGNDFELAAGFLFTEGILQHPRQIYRISYCTDPDVDGEQRYNIVNVTLKPGVSFDPALLQRNFYTTSSCGVCGKASLEAIHACGARPVAADGFTVEASVIARLGDGLRQAQRLFDRTGGIHAAGIFDGSGRLEIVREDVGRHNAVDKAIGHMFLAGRLPADRRILMVSGRASFEIMQKAAMAGIPVVVAVSAPSSLARDAAREFGITLVGFARGPRFNVYAGAERVKLADSGTRPAAAP